MTIPKPISIAQAALAVSGAQGDTRRCVSLATGTLGPDLRVNYEFGLVLGVDEFRQEQLYFLEKGYQHNRGLHGFGTVYGLRVSAVPAPGDPDDLQIAVSPGMAIDQYGRAIVVRAEQCARLGAWLARQVQQNPGVIAERRAGASGELSVYVVASYTECTDALVPIPGQPCSSAEQSTAPSRIRDSFHIELRWAPPAMPAWDAVRTFAELIALVRPVRALPPDLSDEPLLAGLVRMLASPTDYAAALATLLAGTPSDPPRDVFRLPAEEAGAALDRLYTIWATEVRPQAALPPDLSDPRAPAEAGVLLARIDFLPEEPFDPQQPVISYQLGPDGAPAQPDAEGRPFLLHTQLIQELRGPAAPLEGRPFATIAARDGSTLRVWVHHLELLDLPDLTALELTTDAGPVAISAISPVAPNVFDVAVEPSVATDSPQGPPLPPGTLVELRFHLGLLSAGGRPLLDSIDTFAIDYLGRDAATIAVYAITTAIPEVDLPPVQEFVSLQTVAVENRLQFRAWFHTPQPVSLPQTIRVQRGVGPGATQLNFTVQAPSLTARQPAFTWMLTPPGNIRLGAGELLTFGFDTLAVRLEDGSSLADLIANRQAQVLGYDGRRLVRAFHVVSPPPQAGLSEDQVRELIREAIGQLPPPQAPPPRPLMPFVTVTPLMSDEAFQIDLWFHPTNNPDENVMVIDERFAEDRPFRLLAELNQTGGMPDLRDSLGIEQIRPNVFRLFIDPVAWRERAESSRWLRFIFFADGMAVRNERDGRVVSVAEYLRDFPFAFEGDIDQKIIVAYTRLAQPGGF